MLLSLLNSISLIPSKKLLHQRPFLLLRPTTIMMDSLSFFWEL